jgi:hypothetical protein
MLDEGKLQVQKAELLETLKTNLIKHETEYKAARLGYRNALTSKLSDMLSQIEVGKEVETKIDLPKPRNHGSDYTRVIRMLEMSIGDSITINEEQFRQYVMDDWDWRQDFTTTVTRYSQR